MTTREKLLQLIDSLTDEQVEVSYQQLLEVSKPRLSDEQFSDALEGLAALREQLDVSIDAAALIREERDWRPLASDLTGAGKLLESTARISWPPEHHTARPKARKRCRFTRFVTA